MSFSRRLYPRAAIKGAAAALAARCFVHLDLEPSGDVVVTVAPFPGESSEDLRHLSGQLANLLVADLAHRKQNAQNRSVRNLLVAKALDGALSDAGVLSDDATAHGATAEGKVES